MSRRSARALLPFAVAALVVAVVVGVWISVTPAGPDGTPRLGATLSTGDRQVLDAPGVVRGADAPPVDPGVDLLDPEAVARAYLIAAHSLGADDAGRTHLRAAGYAVPGSPLATVGVLVVDPPPPGTQRHASVRALELVASDPADRRRAYLAAVETTTGSGDLAAFTGHVVLAHQPDGRWLVAADTAENPDLT